MRKKSEVFRLYSGDYDGFRLQSALLPANACTNFSASPAVELQPKLARTVPVSIVPADLWARGAQWSQARRAISGSPSQRVWQSVLPRKERVPS